VNRLKRLIGSAPAGWVIARARRIFSEKTCDFLLKADQVFADDFAYHAPKGFDRSELLNFAIKRLIN